MTDAHDMSSALAYIRVKGRKGLGGIRVDKAGYDAIRRATVNAMLPKGRWLSDHELCLWRDERYRVTDGEEIRVCGVPVKIV